MYSRRIKNIFALATIFVVFFLIFMPTVYWNSHSRTLNSHKLPSYLRAAKFFLVFFHHYAEFEFIYGRPLSCEEEYIHYIGNDDSSETYYSLGITVAWGTSVLNDEQQLAVYGNSSGQRVCLSTNGSITITHHE